MMGDRPSAGAATSEDAIHGNAAALLDGITIAKRWRHARRWCESTVSWLRYWPSWKVRLIVERILAAKVTAWL